MGQTFGKLTVTEFFGGDGYIKRSAWVCQCECGNTTIVNSYSLRSGQSTSCGKCNRAKLNLPVSEFRELVISIYNNWASK